jgi:hypothetical protein
MTDEILEKLKTNGLRITYKNKYMQYDDNKTWVVMGNRIHENPFVLCCHPDFNHAFNILLHG